MDHKLTLIKQKLQLGRRAQLRRRVHHQGRPRQGSGQGPAIGGRDGQGDTSCVTLQDRRRFFHFFHLNWRPMSRATGGICSVNPNSGAAAVLQEAEFSRRGPQRPRPRWGNSLEARRLWPEPSQNKKCASCTTRKRGFHRATKAPRARHHVQAGGAECRQGELHPTAAQEHKEAQFR